MYDAVNTAEELWNKWGDELLRYATVLVGPGEARDVAADTLVKVMSDVRPGLWPIEKPYVLRVALNEARMRNRSRTRRERREWMAAAAPGRFDHFELLADPDVLRAVGRLSVRQRAAVYLTYWEDLAPAAVATQMGVSEGTVKRHLARARSQLRKVLS